MSEATPQVMDELLELREMIEEISTAIYTQHILLVRITSAMQAHIDPQTLTSIMLTLGGKQTDNGFEFDLDLDLDDEVSMDVDLPEPPEEQVH